MATLSKPPLPRPVSAFGKEEYAYFLKVAILIVGIYYFRSTIYDYWEYLALVLPALYVMYLWYKSVQTGEKVINIIKENITFIPIPYAEGGKQLFIPKATIILVSINVIIFYVIEASPAAASVTIHDNLMFLPKTSNWWNLLIGPLGSMFMHFRASHLWGNMIFLWAFGPMVEERLGAKKFVLLYLATGLLGKLTSIIVYNLFLGRIYRSIGASGAISGTMGVFMIRCYFKKLVIPMPLLGLVNVKLRINSLLPLGFFFLKDLSGGIRVLAAGYSRIGYWSHVGSMASGIILSALMKLHRDAAEEKYTLDGIAGVEEQVYGIDGEAQLQKALALNADNEAALLTMARVKARRRLEQGRELYERAVGLAVRSDPEKAVQIYDEYFRNYKRMLGPDLEYRLAGMLCSRGKTSKAVRSLEMVVDEPSTSDATREKAYRQLIAMLSKSGNHEKARIRQKQFAEFCFKLKQMRKLNDVRK